MIVKVKKRQSSRLGCVFAKHIPQRPQLVKWLTELATANRISASEYHISADLGNLKYDAVNQFLSLHAEKDTERVTVV